MLIVKKLIVDFNPFNEYLLLTSSNDKTCALWV